MSGISSPAQSMESDAGVTIGGALVALRRRWVFVVAAIVLGAAAGEFVAHQQKPKFQATSVVSVSEVRNLFLSQLVVKAYADAAATTLVLTHVPGGVTRGLARQLDRDPRGVQVPADSNLVRFTVTAPSGVKAARGADEAAAAFGHYVSRSSNGTLRVPLVDAAQIPAFSYSPRKSVSILVGILIGLTAVVFFVLRTDRP